MKVLVAAPKASLAAYVARCDAALGATRHELVAFAHDESRDPTIELPHLAFAQRPRVLVLVAPRREDPATLDAVRRFGTAVVVWFEPQGAKEGRAAAARRHWIACAADAVLASDANSASGLADRSGKAPYIVDGDGGAEVLSEAIRSATR